MTAKSLENLLNLNDDGELGEVLRRAQALGELTETLSNALPEELAGGLEPSVTALAHQEGTLLAATFGNGIVAYTDDRWRIDNRGLTGTDVRAAWN